MVPSRPSLPSTSPHRNARTGVRASFVAAAALATALVALQSSAAAAYAVPGGPPTPTLQPPTGSFSVVRLFDRPTSAWGPGHRGIDIDAGAGDPILAPADGEVTFAGVVVDRGVVTIDHGRALRSSVEPIVPTVQVGDRVRAGDLVGLVSEEPGHCAPATCVHWGVRLGGEYVNPLDVLDGYGPVVLLPLVEGSRADEGLA